MLVSDSGKKYELPPVGVHKAVCIRLVNLGIQETEYGPKKQVHFAFEIEEKMADGRPFLLMQTYTLSLNPKARLYKDLQSWRGRPFSEEELKGFDLRAVLGASLQLSVVHSPDGQFSNIASMVPLKTGDTKLIPVNELLYVNSLPEDSEDFSKLSQKMQERVRMGLQRQVGQQKKTPSQWSAVPMPSEPAPARVLPDDDIPF